MPQVVKANPAVDPDLVTHADPDFARPLLRPRAAVRAGLSPTGKITYRLNEAMRATHTLLPKLHRIVNADAHAHNAPAPSATEWTQFEASVREGLRRRASFDELELHAAQRAGVKAAALSPHDVLTLALQWSKPLISRAAYNEAERLARSATTPEKQTTLYREIQKLAWHGDDLSAWNRLVNKAKPKPAKTNALSAK